MDQGMGNRASPLDAAQDAHLQSKECDYVLESREMVIPSGGSCPNNSVHLLADIIESSTTKTSMSPASAFEHPCSSSRFMDDAATAGVVEELTVKNIGNSGIPTVGTSNSREATLTRQNLGQHFYPLTSGSGSKSSSGDAMLRNSAQGTSGGSEKLVYESFPEFLAQHSSSGNCNEGMEQPTTDVENKEVLVDALAHGAIRTKILSKSGFPEFFIKSTLKGKGIIRRGPSYVDSGKQQDVKVTGGDLDTEENLCSKTTAPSPCFTAKPRSNSEHDGITLRKWLKSGRKKVNKVQSLYIFRQIVQLLDYAHCEGENLRVRPSCFRLLPADQVRYVGLPVQSELFGNATDCNNSDNCVSGKRPPEWGNFSSLNINGKKQKCDGGTNIIKQWPLLYSTSLARVKGTDRSTCNATKSEYKYNEQHLEMKHALLSGKASRCGTSNQQQLNSICDEMEEKWYTSPEELNDKGCTISSDIYRLGVLLFELLVHFDSEIAHSAAMSDMHHRILPPNILSEHPKEAGFCLWLLHPEPSSRPTMREILQSEVISIPPVTCTEDISSSIEQEDADSELLLHFLNSLKEQKLKHASKLGDDIRCLETDIEEVEKRTRLLVYSENLCNFPGGKGNNVLCREPLTPKVHPQFCISSENKLKLTQNISQLESAYFSMRSEIHPSGSNVTARPDREPLRARDSWCSSQGGDVKASPTDCVGTFFGGLCKYARYTKFQVRGVLRNGEFNNSTNVICSLGFDRDEDYFAAAGVSKKIKIYEFNALFNDSVDIHYPAVEMSNESKLSCICWNNYIRNYLASADYDGVVKVWDVNSGQDFLQYTEHQKRAWSVDFSQVDPTKMASGSDDFSVKLWNINERNCLGTIRTIANVCCVQFSAHSSNLLAFGSADYKIYCFDLRNVKSPWCVLAGHDKAVSYVKFLDSETLVSASTDSTLKIWDLSKTTPGGPSTNACKLTLRGHTNEKNFVGLTVSDGYIACGSETNEVYAYYKSFPMPITSHKFGSIDPLSGNETEDDNRQFVSSVCWRGKSDMVVAANSSGCIKVLQMV